MRQPNRMGTLGSMPLDTDRPLVLPGPPGGRRSGSVYRDQIFTPFPPSKIQTWTELETQILTKTTFRYFD